MAHFLFETLWGWWGVAGVVVIVCGLLAYIFPQFRIWAIAVAGVFVSAATIYTKGNRDRAALEARRKEEAVRNARGKYDKIDSRNDTPDDVARRLRDHGF